MIYDCFSFFNELDILEIRLNVLDNVVDKFVLVEATRTHSNQPKPLYFQENKSRFSKFLHKINHIVVDEYPEYINAWSYEIFQRNSLSRGLTQCLDQDLIIISDADEIPNPHILATLSPPDEILGLSQYMFYYHLNQFCTSSPFWPRSRILTSTHLKTYTPTEIRHMDVPTIPNGGWHFSFIGGIDRVILKTEAFAHQEFNQASHKDKTYLEKKIKSGESIYGEKHRSCIVAIDHEFPRYIQENQNTYAHLIQGSNQHLKTIQSIVARYDRIQYLKKLLLWTYLVKLYEWVSLKRYDRRALLKTISPPMFHKFLIPESRKLEKKYFDQAVSSRKQI